MLNKEWTPTELLQLSRNFWSCGLLHAAVDIDVFTALDTANDGQGMNVEELASWIDCDDRAVEIMSTALVAMNLLQRKGSELLCTPFSKRYLSSNSNDFLGNIVRHQANVMQSWTELSKVAVSGEPATDPVQTEDCASRETEVFLRGMQDNALHMVCSLLETFDIAPYKKMLDLGGGTGTYSVFFCKNNPHLQATVLDRNEAANLSVKLAARHGVADRVRFLAGNFHTTVLPGGMDLIWISNVLHCENPEECKDLIQRGVDCLETGGTLAVVDFFLDDDRSGPLLPALMGVNMLVRTKGGRTYTFAEAESMLSDAGLVNIRRTQGKLPDCLGLITGQKA